MKITTLAPNIDLMTSLFEVCCFQRGPEKIAFTFINIATTSVTVPRAGSPCATCTPFILMDASTMPFRIRERNMR